MMRWLLLAVLLAPFLASAQAEDKPDCNLKRIATLDLDMEDSGLMRIPVTLNDKPFRMLVDTGDYYSVITSRTATLLGKEPILAGNFGLIGWGGRSITKYVNLESFGFGRLKRGETQFMVMQDDGDEFDGLIGADFLYYFDLDFDFANARLNLFSPDRCKGKAVYWSHGEFATIPFDWKARQIRLTVKLDGKEVEALLDTGASDTVMSLETAADLFDIEEAKLEEVNGRYPFRELSIGGVTVHNPAIRLFHDKDSGILGSHAGVRMILGMTVLRRLHLYVGYQEEMIYVTPATQY